MNIPLEHLSDAELEAFHKRTSVPAALGEMDGHLSACEACRRRLEEIAGSASLYAQAKMALERQRGEEHLPYEDVRDAAEGRQSPAAARHLELCEDCRNEVADLARFAATLAAAPPSRKAPAAAVRRWAIAALLVIGLLPFAWWIWRRESAPHYQVALRDGGELVAIDSAGKLHTPSGIPPEYSAALRQALRTGRLPVPDAFQRAPRETLLGPTSQAAGPAITIRYPAGEAVLTARPAFEWGGAPGASAYRVSVYDRDFRLVAESPELETAQWTPGTDLAAGQTYTWVVTAHIGKREVRAPVPPVPEAKFTVLARPEAARLADLERQYRGDHFLLAVAFAQSGVLRQARRELASVRLANPGSQLAAALEASLPAGPAAQSQPNRTGGETAR